MMSATPIPRTLAMTLFADLDVSTIDELPPGRTPIETRLFADGKRDEVIARIRDEVARGRQVYWVCPLVEASAALDLQNATETHRQLCDGAARPDDRPDPRPHAGGGEDGGDVALRRRPDRGARRHHGDRGRRRRAERLADGGGARRALRPVAAAPAARPGRPRRDGERLRAALHRAAVGRGQGPPQGDARDQRRLRDLAPRPRDPRSGRAARRAPVGRGAAPLRRSAAGRGARCSKRVAWPSGCSKPTPRRPSATSRAGSAAGSTS